MNGDAMKVSVVISTFNRAAYVEDAIRGVLQLNYGELELVVVNGPSTDNTAEILARWRDKIKVAECKKANLSMSRNEGIRVSSGDIVAFIDDDAVPHPEWLNKIVPYYYDNSVSGVGGYTIDNTGIKYQVRKTLCDRFGNAFYPNDNFDERLLCFVSAPIYPSLLGTNSTFRRKYLEQIGGFDEIFAYLLDETDVCLRLIDCGYKILYEPDALVYHQFAPSHIRSADRIPKTLYQSAVSKSYFIYRHGAKFAPTRAAEQLSRYKSEILSANKWLYDHGKISLNHKTSLDDDLLVGIAEGTRVAMQNAAASGLAPSPHLPYTNTKEFHKIPPADRLRIALVSRQFPPENEAGIARWTYMMAKGLAARGHAVHVVTLAAREPFARFQDGFWVHALEEKPASQNVARAARANIPDGLVPWCAMVFEAIAKLKTFGVEVVSFPIWDMEGALLLEEESLGVVMSLHTTYALAKPFKHEWNIRPLFEHFHVKRAIEMEKNLLSKVDHILANSNAIVTDIEKTYGVSINSKTSYSPHGTLPPIGIDDGAISQKVKNESGRVVKVSYVGRFEARKGFDLACDAITRVLNGNAEDVRVTFVGDEISEETLEGFKIADPSYLLQDRRVFFQGKLSRQALDQIYFESDIVLMPSRYESFGLVAIEAMAAGAAVIALASGGLAEVVRHGVTGFLVNADDQAAEQIANHVNQLLRDRKLLSAMKKSAWEEYKQKYTISKMVDSAEKAYFKARK